MMAEKFNECRSAMEAFGSLCLVLFLGKKSSKQGIDLMNITQNVVPKLVYLLNLGLFYLLNLGRKMSSKTLGLHSQGWTFTGEL